MAARLLAMALMATIVLLMAQPASASVGIQPVGGAMSMGEDHDCCPSDDDSDPQKQHPCGMDLGCMFQCVPPLAAAEPAPMTNRFWSSATLVVSPTAEGPAAPASRPFKPPRSSASL